MSFFFLKPFNDFLFPTEPISKSLLDGSIISSSADVISFSFWDGVGGVVFVDCLL